MTGGVPAEHTIAITEDDAMSMAHRLLKDSRF
jgi:hypothetical protein